MVFTSEVIISVKTIMDFLTLECVTITLSSNVGHQSPNDVGTAYHKSRDLKFNTFKLCCQ